MKNELLNIVLVHHVILSINKKVKYPLQKLSNAVVEKIIIEFYTKSH